MSISSKNILTLAALAASGIAAAAKPRHTVIPLLEARFEPK